MFKFMCSFASIYMIIYASMSVLSYCEKPWITGTDYYGAHVESLCDASMSTSIETLPDDHESGDDYAFVTSANVDHYANEFSALPEGGYYFMEAKTIYSNIINMQIVTFVVEDSAAQYYTGGCSENVTARISFIDPDLAQNLYGEGKANIWGSRNNFWSERGRRYIYDHDRDILDPLNTA